MCVTHAKLLRLVFQVNRVQVSSKAYTKLTDHIYSTRSLIIENGLNKCLRRLCIIAIVIKYVDDLPKLSIDRASSCGTPDM